MLKKTAADYEKNEYASYKNNSWLYDTEKYYWTINIGSDTNGNQYNAIALQKNGEVFNLAINQSAYIKPTFYLKKEILYTNGNGSHNTPYRI